MGLMNRVTIGFIGVCIVGVLCSASLAHASEDNTYDMSAMITDMTGWSGTPGQLTFGINEITINGSNGIAGYTNKLIENETVTMDAKLSFDPHDGWVALSLRTLNPTNPLWDSGHNYSVLVMGNGDIELQKWVGSEQEILATISDIEIKEDELYTIKFGAVDEPEGVRLVLDIDGNEVINHLDQDEPITEKGYFSCMVYQNSSAVLSGTTEVSEEKIITIDNKVKKFGDVEMNNLKELDRWFSIPSSGIAKTHVIGNKVLVTGLGSIGYKNTIDFEKLSFEFKGEFEDDSNSMFILQFNKKRRDSYYDQRLAVDYTNYSYGLTFSRNGQIEIVKMANRADSKTLIVIPSQLDFSETQKISVEMETVDEGVTEFRVYMNDSDQVYAVREEQYGENYANGGYIGVTNLNNKCEITISDLQISGTEETTNLDQVPAPVYLLDYFEENGQKFIHWKYNDGDHNYHKVLIHDENDALIDEVLYPVDTYVIDAQSERKKLFVTPINVDGNEGVTKEIALELTDHLFLATEMNRIAVQKDDDFAYFYEKETGEPFVIKGVNYVRLRFGDHATLEADTLHFPSYYDPYDTETLMKELKANGYNSIRIFVIGRYNLNPGIAGNPDTVGVYKPYMDNFVDLLQKAKKYGIHVLPSMGDGELPISPYYQNMIKGVEGGKNGIYLTEQGIKAKQTYLKDFLTYIKEEDESLLKVLVGIQLQNEMYMNSGLWPFNIEEGMVATANGQTYDMADGDARQRLMNEGTNYYHNAMVEAVKEIDPDLLVSEGVFTLRAVGKESDSHTGVYPGSAVDSRFPPTATVLGDSDLDFIDIHIYHTQEKDSVAFAFKQGMKSMDFYSEEMDVIRKEKPVIMGEFGSFAFMEPTFEEASETILKLRDMALSDDLMGVMVWTFDTFEQKELYHAMGDEGALFGQIPDFDIDLNQVSVEVATEPVDPTTDESVVEEKIDEKPEEVDNNQWRKGWMSSVLLGLAGAIVALVIWRTKKRLGRKRS